MTNFLEKIIQKSPVISEYIDTTDAQKGYLLRETFRTIGEKTPFDAISLNRAVTLTEMLIENAETDRYTVPAAFLYAYTGKALNTAVKPENFNTLVFEIAFGILKFPDISGLNFNHESDNFIKLLLTVMGDVRSVIIRLFEQLRRSREIIENSGDKKNILSKQNFAVFAPAAHRIGLYNLKTDLENLSLKLREPKAYQFIVKKLEGTKSDRILFINKFLSPLKETFNQQGIDYKVKWRTKSVYSIWNKMQKKRVPFEEVFDLFAVRVILDSDIESEKADCWKIYSLITEKYKPDTGRLRDWISFPKSSGYESLHTTVFGPNNRPVEVQIRTARMDDIAENGPAAHWKYKGKEKGDADLWLKKLRDAIENPDIYDNPDYVSKVRAGNEAEEIFVLTPKGDALSLKAGYTIIDLAFSIHTKIGETCTGAMVNEKIQSVDYMPVNGDTIKILTDKNKTPGRDWLRIAKSPRSKAKIKRALKLTTFNRAEEGKELIRSRLNQLKMELSDSSIQTLRNKGGYDSSLEMFHAYAVGKAELKNIKQIFSKPDINPQQHQELPSVYDNVDQIEREEVSGDFLLIDQNLSTIDYTFSKCCNPLPGDKIFGFITVSKGTKIHKTTCPNAKDLKTRYPYRIVPAKWNHKVKTGAFLSEIGIMGRDKTGITSAITKLVTDDFELKIRAIALKAKKNNAFSGTLALKVRSRAVLNELMAALRLLDGVSAVREKQK